jgi:ribosomal protein S18 acetylase RimI-like enzyme
MRSTAALPNTIGSAVRATVGTVLDRFRRDRIQPRVPPRTITDAREQTICIRAHRSDDIEQLVRMYGTFGPHQRTQSLPPVGAAAIRDWVDTLVNGIGVVATEGDRIVGHICLRPDEEGRHELIIFVEPTRQQASIGSELLGAGLGHARENGIEYVWLSVDSTRGHLLRLYSRAGFQTDTPVGRIYRMSRRLSVPSHVEQ